MSTLNVHPYFNLKPHLPPLHNPTVLVQITTTGALRQQTGGWVINNYLPYVTLTLHEKTTVYYQGLRIQ